MALLRYASRMAARQVLQLEHAAATATALQTSTTQAAGFSTAAVLKSSQLSPFQPSTKTWHLFNSSSSNQLQSWRSYSQCDCPPLGGPQPDIVVVEYDEDEVDRFIALADAIEAAFPNIVVEGNPEGVGRPGSFEIKDQSGQLLFSKLRSGAWPQADSVVDALAAAAACNTATAEKVA